MKESSAYTIAYGYLRGFFVNHDVAFKKKWKKSIPKVKRIRKALKKDSVYTFYDVDEKTMTIRFNRELMQRFLSNLKLRDVAITLALLSSSQDSGDLFRLNIGDVYEQKNGRIFLEGNRRKTGVLYRTFFSKEATKFIKRYIQQERQNAEDGEPLFIYTARHRDQQEPIEERMAPNYLASIYRDAARRMGIKWENGEHNPLRPKRMRHLFRTACDTAGISELYTNAFMGHTNHQGQDYSELSKAKLELEYLRVEPFLTVYGEAEESLEIKEEVRKLEARTLDLNKEIQEQKIIINQQDKLLAETRSQFVKLVDFQIWKDQMEQQIREEQEAFKEKLEWQQEADRRRKFTIDGEEKWLDLFEWQEALGISFEEAEERWFKDNVKRKEQPKPKQKSRKRLAGCAKFKFRGHVRYNW